MSLEALFNDKEFMKKVEAIVDSIASLPQPENIHTQLTKHFGQNKLNNSYDNLKNIFGPELAAQLGTIVSDLKNPDEAKQVLQRTLEISRERQKALSRQRSIPGAPNIS